MSDSTMESKSSGIKLVEVRIRNFRCFESIDVALDSLTILIGANNAGKTAFLDALSIAIGDVRHRITEDDVYTALGEEGPPRERQVIIDLLFKPVDGINEVIDSFPRGSFWTEHFGNGIGADENDNDFVAIRTSGRWNSTAGDYATDRKYLSEWQGKLGELKDASINEKAGSVYPAKVEPILLHFMDAKRDILDDMRTRSSYWHKMLSNADMPAEKIKDIEDQLNTLNDEIISGSDIFGLIQDSLNQLSDCISAENKAVTIKPIARNIRDLSKGVDIDFSTNQSKAFPISRHGMGTRSLASILTFKAFSSWRQQQARGTIHNLLGMEEPEAHLHPHAQRMLLKQIEGIVGQRIVSTHSPYFINKANIAQLRHFKKDGSKSTVSQIDVDLLDPEDIRKINRMVMNTRGDIVFSKAIVLFEGETEEQALPLFAEKVWGMSPVVLEVSFVGVGGYGSYTPFLRLADAFSIPWYILSDGESDAITGVNECLGKVDRELPLPNVSIIPENEDFEACILLSAHPEWNNSRFSRSAILSSKLFR